MRLPIVVLGLTKNQLSRAISRSSESANDFASSLTPDELLCAWRGEGRAPAVSVLSARARSIACQETEAGGLGNSSTVKSELAAVASNKRF